MPKHGKREKIFSFLQKGSLTKGTAIFPHFLGKNLKRSQTNNMENFVPRSGILSRCSFWQREMAFFKIDYLSEEPAWIPAWFCRFSQFMCTLSKAHKKFTGISKVAVWTSQLFQSVRRKKVNPFEIPKKSGMNCYCAELLTRVKKKKEESCSCCGHLNETQIAAGIFLNAFHLANE